ncbi:hypothetical protein ACKWRH_06125 [Bradyrhizobium sp. Pa8]|uniref:hypothetical protein n=1 Tax=Bradyrhizobium sp. Pa8 TaxID=3386552 RepID=UPI00403F6838
MGDDTEIGSVSPMRISIGARRELTAAVVAERYRSAGWADKGGMRDELCAVTGWHRKHAERKPAMSQFRRRPGGREGRPMVPLSGMR